MSWRYLPEAAAVYWEGSSWDGKPYAMSSGMNIAQRCSKPEYKKAISQTLQSGTMSELSTGNPGVDWWILSLPVSPASPSASQANAVPSWTTEICGLRPFVSYRKCGPNGAYWKMCPVSSMQATATLGKYSGPWPNSGLLQDGLVYLLPPLVRTITEIGSGLWPTPLAGMRTRPYPKGMRKYLAEEKINAGNLLAIQIFALDYPEMPPGMHVNPGWLEWLMGWPIGWSALEPLATAKFRQWSELHGLR